MEQGPPRTREGAQPGAGSGDLECGVTVELGTNVDQRSRQAGCLEEGEGSPAWGWGVEEDLQVTR